MGEIKMNIYKVAMGLVAVAAMLMTVLFTNCSDIDFSGGSDNNTKVAGNPDAVQVEAIDHSGMEGTPITEENLDDLEEELNNRRQNRQTEVYEIPVYAECGENKALICHIPPGNLEARHEICVSVNALKAHVGKHTAEGFSDIIGRCIDLF